MVVEKNQANSLEDVEFKFGLEKLAVYFLPPSFSPFLPTPRVSLLLFLF